VIRRTGRDRGGVAVEFALVLPVLIVIVSGLIDAGDALRAKVQLQEAVQDGAAFAVSNSGKATLTRDRVLESSPDLAATSVTVSCSGNAPTVVTVRATLTHHWLVGVLAQNPSTFTAEVQGDLLSASGCVAG
jgi:Flp pilus assembly protein TadG